MELALPGWYRAQVARVLELLREQGQSSIHVGSATWQKRARRWESHSAPKQGISNAETSQLFWASTRSFVLKRLGMQL